MARPSWMYIVRCREGSYYVGKANNLHFRIGEHSGAIPSHRESRFVKKKGFDCLVYFEELPSERAALARESALKHWHPLRYRRRKLTPIRQYKDYLVAGFPRWKLDAFHATTSDFELRSRLAEGAGAGMPDFIPLAPVDWWKQRTLFSPLFAGSNPKPFEIDVRPDYRGVFGCLGLIVMFIVFAILGN